MLTSRENHYCAESKRGKINDTPGVLKDAEIRGKKNWHRGGQIRGVSGSVSQTIFNDQSLR